MAASCVLADRSGDALRLDGVAVALFGNDIPRQLLLLLLSALDEDREGRCDGGIEIGGASLCVRRDRP